MAKNLKKLTLLHSNDMHGDFLTEDEDNVLTGGVALLSGYVNHVRKTEQNVLYCVAGDMFRGSVIDSEYLGTSTIQIMNLLAPDVVTLGNHETDYGLSHLLFLEKCANFPIVNANMRITSNGAHLFEPYRIIEIDGMKILFIGILTEDVMSQTKKDGLVGTLINVEDAVAEVGRICNTYNAADIDFTVLLTHIGWEEDHKLAALLDPAWGVDVIIGGHSHTFIDAPDEVSGVLIVQAGTGTDQIGRFDIMVDTDRNCVDSCEWQAVPINEVTCVEDPDMHRLIGMLKSQTDAKYDRFISRFMRQLTHPDRRMETELGNVVADAILDATGMDLVFFGSGSIRNEKMGPMITYRDLTECFPYDDSWWCVHFTGEQLKRAWKFVNRDEVWEGAHCEYYQLSRGMRAVYNRETHELEEFSLNGEPILDERIYRVAVPNFHYSNLPDVLAMTYEEADANKKSFIISTSNNDMLEEWFAAHPNTDMQREGRIQVVPEPVFQS